MARDRERSDLDTDRMFYLSMVRLLEVLGEASSRVETEYRERHPDVPWREIADLRNRLIHGYDKIDLNIVWQIVTNDLPPLIEQLRRIVDAHI